MAGHPRTPLVEIYMLHTVLLAAGDPGLPQVYVN